jgi:cytochrome P450
MVYRDPPDHTRMRRLVGKLFARTVLDRARPRIEALAKELVDRIASRERFDLVSALARPLPVRVIAELMGARPEDGMLVEAWSDDIARLMLGEIADPARHDRANTALGAMARYFRDIVVDRRRTPRQDLTSALLAAAADDSAITEDEIVATCALMVFAGHETTTNLIANATLALIDHPDALEAAGTRLGPEAIDELLRFDGPMKALSRVAREDVHIGDTLVKGGDRVLCVLATANRDPDRFADPDRLDLARGDSGHLAFGSGPHLCIGAALAKLEAQIVISTLLARFERMELAVPRHMLEWRPALLARALEALPLER